MSLHLPLLRTHARWASHQRHCEGKNKNENEKKAPHLEYFPSRTATLHHAALFLRLFLCSKTFIPSTTTGCFLMLTELYLSVCRYRRRCPRPRPRPIHIARCQRESRRTRRTCRCYDRDNHNKPTTRRDATNAVPTCSDTHGMAGIESKDGDVCCSLG